MSLQDRQSEARYQLIFDLRKTKHQLIMNAEHIRFAAERVNKLGVVSDPNGKKWNALLQLHDDLTKLATNLGMAVGMLEE